MELDRVPLWRGDCVPIKQLAEDFARYLYLPRLTETGVLVGAIRDGLGLLTWKQESFVYADSFDDTASRYRGLRAGQLVAISEENLSGVLVRPDVAMRQLEEEAPTPPGPMLPVPGSETGSTPPGPSSTPPRSAPGPKRFHGTVTLDSTRVGRDAGKISEEVISHLAALVGSSVTVTLEIEANIPKGVPDNVVRTVIENARTLRFTNQGFETE
jgi:hypothetical protein